MRHLAILSFFLLLASLAGPRVEAQQSTSDLLLVLINTASTDPSTFHQVITDNILLELRRASIRPLVADEIEGLKLRLEEIDPTEPVEISRLAQELGTPLAVTGTYAQSGRELAITLRAYDAVEGVLIGQEAARAPIDLTLDEAVEGVIVRLVPVLTERLTLYRVPGVVGPDGTTNQVADSAIRQATGQPIISGARPGPPPPKRGDRFDLTAGLAPFVTTGSFGTFLGAGLGPAVSLVREIGPQLGVGLFAAVTGFIAEGPLQKGQGLLVPAGIEARYFRDLEGSSTVYFHAGGGPALFLINTDQTGVVFKLIPSVSAGLGFARMLKPQTGIAFGAAVMAYLESGELLMGIVPSINVVKRF